MRRATGLAAALAALALPAATVSASGLAAGSLDPSYGSGGAVLDDFYGTQDPDQANAVAIQPDGKIVIAGSSGTGHQEPIVMVARYNVNGTPDGSFGPPPHGFLIQQVCFSGSCAEAEADAVALEPNGDIVVAGVALNNECFYVMRLTPAGALDSSFAEAGTNPSGIDAFQIGGVTTGYHVGGVAVQADGNIVVDGTFGSTPEGFIARVLSGGGSLDTGGWASPNGYFAEFPNSSFTALALQPSDGKAVAVGTDTSANRLLIARFTTSGAEDSQFNYPVGFAEASIGSGPDTGAALLATADGRLIVAGTDQTGAGAGIGLFEFQQSSGQLDPSFGSGGDERVSLPAGDAGTLSALALDPSGRLLVAGQDTTRQQLFVARLSAAGALDGSFGAGGFSIPSIGSSSSAQAVTADAAGNPVLAGFGIAVGRFDTDALTARVLGAAPSAPPPPAPPQAPILSALTQSHSTWREPPRRKRVHHHRRQPPVGTTFSFSLDEQATVRFAFVQQRPGRRVRGKCATQNSHDRHKPACTSNLSRGSLIVAAHAGLNRVQFDGLLPGPQKLPPGPYFVTITASASALTSTARTLRFTIAA